MDQAPHRWMGLGTDSFAVVGCSVLSHFAVTFDFRKREVRLRPTGKPGYTENLMTTVRVNGKPLWLMVDSGATKVFLEPWAALDLDLITEARAKRHDARGASLGRTWIRGIAKAPRADAESEAGALEFLNELEEGNPGALSATLASAHLETLDLEKRRWRLVSSSAKEVLWEARALRSEREGRGILLRKRIAACDDPSGFHLRVEFTVLNEDPDLEGRELLLRVRGAGQVHPPEGARDLLHGRVKVRGVSGPKNFTGPEVKEAADGKEPKTVSGDLEWAATTTTYFAAILDPDDPAGDAPRPGLTVRMDGIAAPKGMKGLAALPQPSPLLSVDVGVPKAGVPRTVGFTFYVGPTANEISRPGEHVPVLDREEYAIYKPVRDPGMFDLISQGLFYVLKGFHSLIPNWGVAIILLTVLVRGLMFPLSRKQMKSTLEYARKMQKVKPKLDALREKYGKDRRRMAEEQMRLMKEHGVPLMPGGCLLTFLQLPIWFALYGMLQGNFDLRHAEFLWILDLSDADRLWRMLPGVASIPLVPNALEYLNLLPLLMTGSWFFASQATMTPPADEQQAQMQAMMKWMPFVMLLMPGFYTMPAGLCLYITASSTWGIVESRFIRRKYAAETAAA
ncbi:MAG: membrane protein insertase YidC [Planctomycetaceae bacterium]|nr:membrane protein insertase YidC [Planctomycetaceae bacterium]